jgi:hypothetical protein
MDENQAKEDLSYIKKIIENTRNVYIENGLYYIFIGTLIVVAIFGTQIAIYAKRFSFILWIWIIDCIVIFVLITIINIKKRRQQKVKTFTDKINRSVWIALYVTIALFGILSIIQPRIELNTGLSLISGILGIGYFINHNIIRSRWLIVLAIGWWGGAILLYFLPGNTGAMVMGILVILLEIIPGICLYSNWKKKRKSI